MGAAFPRDGAIWVLAYTLAVLGDVAYYLVLTWAAAEAGGASGSAAILAAGSVPRLLLLLAGGMLADRVDPRRIAIWTDTARAATLIAAALLTFSLGSQLWWLIVVAVIFGMIDACFLPAVGAMPARLVPPEALTRLQGWRITGLRIANAVGPVAGGVLLGVGGEIAFGALALLFAVSVLLLRRIRPRSADVAVRTSDPQVGAAGWRDIQRLRIVPLVIGTALSELPFAGPVAAAIVLMVNDRGWPAGIAGVILAGFSVGALVTSLAMSTMRRTGGRAVVLVSVAATAGLLLFFGGAADVGTAILSGAGLGVTSGTTMVLCQGQVQRSTPPALLGRVTAVLTLLTFGLSPLAYAGVGLVADTAGLPMFFAATAAVVVAAGVVLATVRFGSPEPIAAADR